MALQDVLVDELRDMYSAENQLVKALPKLAKGAKDAKLKQLFTDHLEETKGQVLRLRTVFEHLGEKPTGEHCNGMEGVIEEGADALEKDEEGRRSMRALWARHCGPSTTRLPGTRRRLRWRRRWGWTRWWSCWRRIWGRRRLRRRRLPRRRNRF